MKRKFRKFISYLLTAAILTSSINLPAAAAQQPRTVIQLSNPAGAEKGQVDQKQGGRMQSDQIHN